MRLVKSVRRGTMTKWSLRIPIISYSSILLNIGRYLMLQSNIIGTPFIGLAETSLPILSF